MHYPTVPEAQCRKQRTLAQAELLSASSIYVVYPRAFFSYYEHEGLVHSRSPFFGALTRSLCSLRSKGYVNRNLKTITL